MSSGNASWDAQCWTTQAPPVGVWPSCHSDSVGFRQVWLQGSAGDLFCCCCCFWVYIRAVASCVLASHSVSPAHSWHCAGIQNATIPPKRKEEKEEERFFKIFFASFLCHLHNNNKHSNRILAFSNYHFIRSLCRFLFSRSQLSKVRCLHANGLV